MKKLIILGAGANVDFGFPTGVELSKSIHSVWSNPDDEYIDFLILSLKNHGKKFYDPEGVREKLATRIKRLSERFYYAGAESVDDFLSQHLEDFEVPFGKLTILNLLLEKEKESIIEGHSKTLFKWETNWLRILFGQEFRFGTIQKLNDKLIQNPVKFITFNYDRSLEYFIFNAVKNYYGIEQGDAVSIYKKIEIYHVYGKLAPLEWESDDPNNRLKFGDELEEFPYDKNERLHHCASNIKVVNEDRSNFESIKNKCNAWIQESDKVYILGFGFLESNYELLGIEEYKQSCPNSQIPVNKLYYTTYGLSKNKKERLVANNFGYRAGRVCRANSYDLEIYDYILHHY